MIIHFLNDTPYAASMRLVACGLWVRADFTDDPEKVTCKNCKRTVSYRTRKAET